MKTEKPKIKHTIEEMKLTCKIVKIGTGAHILLPKKLIGEEVFVYYKKENNK